MSQATPTSFKSPFLQEASWRGFIYQGTNLEELDQRLISDKTPMPFYIGFDATADSLHVGNLMGIMLARVAQRNGLKPIILMGGGTTKIGDPSGKTEARQLLDDAAIDKNIASIRTSFEQFLTFGNGPTDAVMVNNDDWLKDLNYIAFLRDFGRYFSVNRMLSMDSVKSRLEREQNLSFLEFNYMILQGYDFYWLNKNMNCQLQLGGSDQWGNIVQGTDLVRRITGNEVFGLTAPLIQTANGEKMGKTHKGAIWLHADKLGHYDYWQFWRNCDDADITRFMKFYTDLPLDEIENLGKFEGEQLNEAKQRLAHEATTLLHGKEAALQSKETASKLFCAPVDVADIVIEGFDDQGNPQTNTTMPVAKVEANISVLHALKILGFAASNGEAKRLIKGKGVRINDAIVEDDTQTLSVADFAENGLLKLSAGKKRHGLVYLKR